MTSPMKYTRFFMQHDRVHTALSGDAAVVCMRGQAGVLAETRLEQETARSALLAADCGDSVVGVRSQGQPEAVTYNAYGYHNANDIPLHRPAFNGHLLLWYLYLLGNGYRAFNPVLMCFQSPDSQSPFAAGGLNCYAYCAGDPVNFSDPSGHVRTRSPSPRRSMSPATQERIVLDALNSQPGWNPGGVKRRRLSSATQERIVREVLNTQPGWSHSGAPVQSSSRHDLASSNAGTTVAITGVRQPENHSASLKRADPVALAKFTALNDRNKYSFTNMSIEDSRRARQVGMDARQSGASIASAVRAVFPDITDATLSSIRRGATRTIKRTSQNK
ncbi:RHS repeat-associated core domain-containing protein [Pseudomonas asiatica]|uniref:RHS repeat-associated core domain-containing protein n=1 Tax=Pseudomonas asiatica TaxID=2219225 RepID=UPI0015FA43ED|nr:RHS repeat-associated core domain-containing protein [Pseudomonas asiatica]MBA6111634.1 RHS repeat-associated core domain-containing protein [Pseudomonas asiatica]